MSHFLPFYVQHSKGFISRLVEIARCGHYDFDLYKFFLYKKLK